MNCFGLKEGTIIINQNHLAAKFTHNFPEFVFIYLEQLRILLYFGVVSEKKIFFFSKTFIFASDDTFLFPNAVEYTKYTM